MLVNTIPHLDYRIGEQVRGCLREMESPTVMDTVRVYDDYIDVVKSLYPDNDDLIESLEYDLVGLVGSEIQGESGIIYISRHPDIHIEWKRLDGFFTAFQLVYFNHIKGNWECSLDQSDIAKQAIEIAREQLARRK